MSLSLYEKMRKLYKSLQQDKTVEVILKPDQLKKIRIPQALIDISKEQGISYDDLVSFILTEFNNRMVKDIRMYTQDIINVIKTYPDLTEEKKKDLLVYILKNLNMEIPNG